MPHWMLTFFAYIGVGAVAVLVFTGIIVAYEWFAAESRRGEFRSDL